MRRNTATQAHDFDSGEEVKVQVEPQAVMRKDILNLNMNYVNNNGSTANPSSSSTRSRHNSDETQIKRDVDFSRIRENDFKMSSAVAHDSSGFEIDIKDDNKVSERLIGNFTLYEIYIKRPDQAAAYCIERRFSDFEWLYEEICSAVPYLIVPALPEKNILTKISMESDIFRRERRRSLVGFLKKVVSHPSLRNLDKVNIFLTESRQQFEKVCKQSGESPDQSSIVEKGQKVIGSVGSYLTAAVSNISTINTFFWRKPEEKKELTPEDRRFEEAEKFLTVLGTRIEEASNCIQQINTKNHEQVKNLHEMSVIFGTFAKESSVVEGTANGLSSKMSETRKIHEDFTSYISEEFEFSLKETMRDIFAAKEALRRRKELIARIERSQEILSAGARSSDELEAERRRQRGNQELLIKTNLTLTKEFEEFKKNIVGEMERSFTNFKEKQDEYNQKALGIWNPQKKGEG